jgi:integrase
MALHVEPPIGSREVRAVSLADLYGLLHRMAHGHDAIPVEANRVHGSLRHFFRWCRKAGLRDDDPTDLLDKPTKVEPSAKRRREGSEPLLDISELAELLNAAPTLPGAVLPYLVPCILMMPMRRDEWTRLEWREVQTNFTADGWTGAALNIPATRMKGRRPAVVPLPASVLKIIEGRRKFTGGGRFVFSVPGKSGPFAGWRSGADVLRAALNNGRSKANQRHDWSLHTIRHSVATAMVRDLGADELLVGRILQHSPRNVLGVTEIYQRSPRLAEQAALLDRWSTHLRAVAARLQRTDNISSYLVTLRPGGTP